MARRAAQSGFTLIELLVSIAILGVLFATSLQSFKVYRQLAYDSMASQLMKDTRIAVEAGRIKLDEEEGPEWFWAWTDGNGVLQGWRVNDFVPGLKTGQRGRLFVNFNTWCTASNIADWCPSGQKCCSWLWVEAYHCRSETVKAQTVWNTGEVDEWEWANGGTC